MRRRRRQRYIRIDFRSDTSIVFETVIERHAEYYTFSFLRLCGGTIEER